MRWRSLGCDYATREALIKTASGNASMRRIARSDFEELENSIEANLGAGQGWGLGASLQ